MPMAPAISPPIRKLIFWGETFEKLMAGATTLAAILVLSVATTSTAIENRPSSGLPASALRRASRSTGFQMASP